MSVEINTLLLTTEIKTEPEEFKDPDYDTPLNVYSSIFVKEEEKEEEKKNENQKKEKQKLPNKKDPKSKSKQSTKKKKKNTPKQPPPATESFICPHCNIVIDTRQRFSSHMKIHKVPTHKCTKCERLFKSAKNMAKHECAICSVCGLKTISKHDLRLHMKKFHAEAASAIYSVQCDYCGKLIKTKTYLIHHMRAEHVKDETTTLLCTLCGQKFPHKFLLDKHMKIKHAELEACKLCGKVVKPLCMPYHMRQVHASERNFTCTECGMSFKTKCNFRDHLKTHNKTHACQFCEKKFARPDHLREHVLLHTDPEAFNCMVCGHKYSTLAYLKRHMRAHEDAKVNCRLCGVEVSALSLHYHLKHAHPLDRFVCGKCNCSGFASQHEYKEHMRMHEKERVVREQQEEVTRIAAVREANRKRIESEAEMAVKAIAELAVKEDDKKILGPVKSDDIEKGSDASDDDSVRGDDFDFQQGSSPPSPQPPTPPLSPHKIIPKTEIKTESSSSVIQESQVYEPQPFDMFLCDVVPRFKKSPQQQQQSKKQRKKRTPWLHLPSEATLTCDHCGAEFDKKVRLITHMQRHMSGENRCAICGKCFSYGLLLQRHMLSHDSTLVACQLCGKQVKPHCMTNHIKQVHASYKAFRCDTCSKLFKSRQNLREHERIHDKRFQCETCGRHFPRSIDLREHMEVHHNPAAFECSECGMRLADRRSLKVHMSRGHGRFKLDRPRPFRCELCDYSCSQKNNLKIHMRRHERHERRKELLKDALSCEQCGALFTKEICLRMHYAKVHSDERFLCTHCESVMKTKNGLYKHLRVQHNVEPEQVKRGRKRKEGGRSEQRERKRPEGDKKPRRKRRVRNANGELVERDEVDNAGVSGARIVEVLSTYDFY